ncbi:MAG: sigma-54 factor interaction domain-containing protein, partial [Deltaproteobacteria bacterium]|nr:sigma-54 factor interaction domain-containing protein [Deltaproteobacteria bacterium]
MQRILVSWIGTTDLNKAADGRGMIQDVLAVARQDGQPFTRVVVLDDGSLGKAPPDAQNRALLQEKLAESGTAVDWRDLSGVPRMEVDALAAAACDVLDDACTGLGPHDSVELGVSSGMWTMSAALLLARTRFSRPFPLWVGRNAPTARESAEQLPPPKGLTWTPLATEAPRAAIGAEEAIQYQKRTATVTKASGVVTRCPTVRQVYETASRLAHLDDAVVVLGPTGAGKEMVARLLHHDSGRRGEFVAVNCGAIPAELAEAELFGAVQGAGTQTAARRGKLALAHNGTLFLDEVGELPLALQVKLLRALEDRAVTAVGADKRTDAQFRLVAATHRPLMQMVSEGNFREDLYYRIATHELVLPPLRDRGRDDIELLFKFQWKQV